MSRKINFFDDFWQFYKKYSTMMFEAEFSCTVCTNVLNNKKGLLLVFKVFNAGHLFSFQYRWVQSHTNIVTQNKKKLWYKTRKLVTQNKKTCDTKQENVWHENLWHKTRKIVTKNKKNCNKKQENLWMDQRRFLDHNAWLSFNTNIGTFRKQCLLILIVF